MNGQEIKTQNKADSGKTPSETKTESRSASAGGAAGTLGENARNNGSETSGRRRKGQNEADSIRAEENKTSARNKIETQIETLKSLQALV
jgi:hypothetical protein